MKQREIKFKAFYTESREMLTGSLRQIGQWLEEKQPIEVMQFTGLTDKNGVEIYEFDILNYEYKRGVVVWYGEGWVVADLGIKCIEPKYHGKTPYEVWKNNLSCVEFDTIAIYNTTLPVIIGNIHQNPELL